MQYLSGNRDERAIQNPHQFIVDRKRPRQHLSFGFGVHRCVDSRVAEMQLVTWWEKLLTRELGIHVAGESVQTFSSFVHGFTTLPVRVT